MYFELGENWTYWLYGWGAEGKARKEGRDKVNVPDRVLAFRQGFKALTCCRIPDAAVECTLAWIIEQKGNFCAYINPSQAHETIRLASRLKCTAVT